MSNIAVSPRLTLSYDEECGGYELSQLQLPALKDWKTFNLNREELVTLREAIGAMLTNGSDNEEIRGSDR